MNNEFDLFEDLANNPSNYPNDLVKLIEAMEDDYNNACLDYIDLANYVEKAEAIGYTFDYGLDAEAFGLKKIVS